MATDRAEDTIFAPLGLAGRSAVTSLRISGERTLAVLRALGAGRPQPRRASLRALRTTDGELLDRALVIWFPAPGSFTGEDCAEFHLHGGVAVLHGVADALMDLGVRPADPGEFSRRAFLNGRMDLLQAEAISDLVAAETAGQRHQALRQMDGALGTLYQDWSRRLTRVLAHQEALIDFPDEDLPDSIEQALRDEIAALRAAVGAHLHDGRRGERLREGLVFAVVGPPNAGKSTLVNALARREVAIVSAEAGTTRDAIEVRMDLGGVPVTVVDTAGLREATGEIEAEGVRRAVAHAEAADLAIVVHEAGRPGDSWPLTAPRVLHVATKIDLAAAPGDATVGVSAVSGAGLDDLREHLCQQARDLTANHGPPPLTRLRHRRLLEIVQHRLADAMAEKATELRAEDLRGALHAIGQLTGKIGVEQLLDSIFRDFCIGK